MMIVGILSGIVLVAVMLYLDKRQQEEIDKLRRGYEWNYKAIIVLARIVKENQQGYYDPEQFYDEVIDQ